MTVINPIAQLVANDGASNVDFLQSGTGSAVRTVENKLRDAVSVKDFGAKGDGVTDDRAAIQKAIDAMAAAGGGEVVIPHTSAFYRTRLALQAKSGVTVRVPNNATRIVCTADEPGLAKWPLYACWYFGGYTTPNYVRATAYAINNVTAGDPSITTTTATNAGNFAVGDVVAIETASTYTVGTDAIPTWLQVNVVESANASTGVLVLRYPVDQTRTSVQIRQLMTNTTALYADGTVSTYPLRAVRDFAIIGGTWENALTEAPFMGDGGLIDGVIKPHKVVSASSTAYGNLFAHCRLGEDVLLGTRIGPELAFGSHNNVVDIGTIRFKDFGHASPRFVGMNEGARQNLMRIGALNGGALNPSHIIEISNSYSNRLEIGAIFGEGTPGADVLLNKYAYVGTSNDTYNNEVHVTACSMTSQLRYIQVNSDCYRNKVSGRYFGTATTDAISIIGNNNEIDAWCENGTLAVSGALGNIIKGNLGTDRGPGVDFSGAFSNNYNQESNQYRTLRQLGFRASPSTHTSTSGLTRTTTFPAATLRNGDTIAFKILANAVGSVGTKTVTISFAGTTIYTATIAAGTTNSSIEGVVLVQGSTVAVAFVTGVIGATPGSTDTAVTGVNFTTTAYDFVVTGTVAGATDFLNIRYFAMEAFRTQTDSRVLVG